MTGAGRLKAWRDDQKWSQAKLASELEVEQGTVSRWESGASAPMLKLAIRIARMTKGKVPVHCWNAEENRGAA